MCRLSERIYLVPARAPVRADFSAREFDLRDATRESSCNANFSIDRSAFTREIRESSIEGSERNQRKLYCGFRDYVSSTKLRTEFDD